MPRTSKLTNKGNGSPDSLTEFDAISRRAYEIYEGRGRTDGAALDDWLEAERQLRQAQSDVAIPPPVKPRRRKGTGETGL